MENNKKFKLVKVDNNIKVKISSKDNVKFKIENYKLVELSDFEKLMLDKDIRKLYKKRNIDYKRREDYEFDINKSNLFKDKVNNNNNNRMLELINKVKNIK